MMLCVWAVLYPYSIMTTVDGQTIQSRLNLHFQSRHERKTLQEEIIDL